MPASVVRLLLRCTFLLLVGGTLAVSLGAAPDRQKAPKPKKPAPTKPAEPAKDDPTEKIGRLRFSPPRGWEMAEKEGIVVLTPKEVKPTDCSIIVVSGEALKGDFIQWFKRKWTALAGERPIAQGGQRNVQEGEGGTDVIFQSALLGQEKGKQVGLTLYAVSFRGGVDWVVYQARSLELYNKHNATAGRFIKGLSIREEETVEVPSPKPKKPAKKPRTPPAGGGGG